MSGSTTEEHASSEPIRCNASSFALSGSTTEEHASSEPIRCNASSFALGKRMRVPTATIHKGSPTRKASLRNSVPGPGSYSVNTKFTTPSPPAFSFGIPLSRPSLDVASTPGPGSYHIKPKPFGPSFSITGREHGFKFKDTPGPGTYDHARRSDASEGPAFSLGARIKPPSRNSESPGPGSYPFKTKPSGPYFSITGKISPSRSDDAPGPGAYSQPSRSSSPAFSLYGKAHDPKMPVDVPGPGAYKLPSTREGPSFSLLSRISPLPECNSSTPGPGNYPAPLGRAETPAFSFGSRLPGSNNSSRDNSPGPGEYNTRMSPATPSFSFGSKPPVQKVHLGPGPGSYESIVKPSGPQYSLHNRVANAANTASFPGPGTYNPQYIPRYRPAFSIKGKIEVPVRVDTPGPGAYRPVMDLVVAAAPKFSLGGKVEGLRLNASEKPGPGAYGSQEHRQEGPAFSILKRIEVPTNASKDFPPGPGTYKLVYGQTDSPAFSFGNRMDQFVIRKDVPGPGTYRLEYKGSGPSFSITGKPAGFSMDPNPGPGSYHDRLHAVGKNGPFFSLLGKIGRKQRDSSPGPGAYRPKLRPDGPSFSIYGRLTPLVKC